jgi:predicted GIY-YIG superfamily endonuclease
LKLEFSECLGNRSRASQAEFRVKRLDRKCKEDLIAGQLSLADLLRD